jgi:hypothetical protein
VLALAEGARVVLQGSSRSSTKARALTRAASVSGERVKSIATCYLTAGKTAGARILFSWC